MRSYGIFLTSLWLVHLPKSVNCLQQKICMKTISIATTFTCGVHSKSLQRELNLRIFFYIGWPQLNKELRHDLDMTLLTTLPHMTLTYHIWPWLITYDLDYHTWPWLYHTWPWPTTHDLDLSHMTLTYHTWPWLTTHDLDISHMTLTYHTQPWHITHDLDLLHMTLT